MRMPFSSQEFFAVFGRYNEAVWPLQILFVVIGVAAAAGVWLRIRHVSTVAVSFLAILWAWMGVVYHGMFFRPVTRWTCAWT